VFSSVRSISGMTGPRFFDSAGSLDKGVTRTIGRAKEIELLIRAKRAAARGGSSHVFSALHDGGSS